MSGRAIESQRIISSTWESDGGQGAREEFWGEFFFYVAQVFAHTAYDYSILSDLLPLLWYQQQTYSPQSLGMQLWHHRTPASLVEFLQV